MVNGNNIKNKIKDIYFKYLTFFTIGSFIGCIFETIVAFIKKGYLVSRQGLIYGPFTPVYGIGIVLAVIFLERFRKNNKKLPIFVFGGIACGLAEYICSFVQEFVFHTYSWNYSKYPLNIHGRTSLFHMIIWGLLIFCFMQFIYPWIIKFIDKVSNRAKILLSIFVTIFFVINITISSVACMREYERFKKMPPSNDVEVILDKYYSDEFLKKVYPNKRYKKEKKF